MKRDMKCRLPEWMGATNDAKTAIKSAKDARVEAA
jgi:hypothetical protein